ncbi:MAG: hypothetical protein IT196_20140 [Acidimicrobiales bacterium]|nr:hypothetical protein [Acidimicrobiales bacterium]
MCKKIVCSSCGRPSWAGCGAHVEQVLGDVAPADRCRCNAKGTAAAKATVKGGGAAPASAGGRRGLLGRLRGR